MRFRAGPGFQTLAGIAEIEMRHGIGRVLLEAGFKGRACFLVLVLFQEFVTSGKFLGTIIKECGSPGRVIIEPEPHDESKDLSHELLPRSAEETITPILYGLIDLKTYTSRIKNTTAQGHGKEGGMASPWTPSNMRRASSSPVIISMSKLLQRSHVPARIRPKQDFLVDPFSPLLHWPRQSWDSAMSQTLKSATYRTPHSEHPGRAQHGCESWWVGYVWHQVRCPSVSSL